MIDMLPVDACMLKPTLQRTAVYEMRYMAAAEFPSDADIEAERKDLVELLSRNIFSSDDGTARAVVVVAERKTTHGVTYRAERRHEKEPGRWRAQSVWRAI
jgi:hypothetical protein